MSNFNGVYIGNDGKPKKMVQEEIIKRKAGIITNSDITNVEEEKKSKPGRPKKED